MAFQNRSQAGRMLAEHLMEYADRPDVVILGLPRGGVPVAFEVAQALHAPLDIFVVRKLGVPGHEELAMGAVATGGVRVVNWDVVRELGIPDEDIETVTERERFELERRERAYRGGPAQPIRGKIVILIDDGLATGSSMRAAIVALKHQRPARLVVAVPIGSPDVCDELRSEVDEVICLFTPAPFYGLSVWYQDFAQTSDAEVRDLLDRASQGVFAVHGALNKGRR